MAVSFGLAGNLHFASDLTDEAIAKQERAERIAAYVALHRSLSAPLPCDATVSQRSAGKWDGPRCYVASSTKEKLNKEAQ